MTKINDLKTFIAFTEERYTWECPYCNEMCDDYIEDPSDSETIFCEHCGKEAICERTNT